MTAETKPKKNAQAETPAAEAKEPVKPYEPTKREKTALEAYANRRHRRKPAPRLKVVSPSELKIDHADLDVGCALLLEATGSADADFLDGLLKQLANVRGNGADEDGINFMLSIVKGIEPRDQLEAMLAAQMAVVHNATMIFARRLNLVENIPQQDSAERAFNKLARTFTSQMEALKRYRSEGQQKILVQHTTTTNTTVNADQAVVTTGNATNPAVPGDPTQSPALLTAATEKPMQMLDGQPEPEPLGVGVGKEKE
jgi:hypothetical protein